MAQPKRQDKADAATQDVKAEAHRLIDNLPDGATWEDVLYAIQTRLAIDDGRKACREGRVTPQEEIEKLFGVTK